MVRKAVDEGMKTGKIPWQYYPSLSIMKKSKGSATTLQQVCIFDERLKAIKYTFCSDSFLCCLAFFH